VLAKGLVPRPGPGYVAVSRFFPPPTLYRFSETLGAHEKAAGRVRRPSGAPGSVRRAAWRGPGLAFG